MRCITLLTVFILAMLAVCSNAGKVEIKGKCVNCNSPTTTTKKPTAAHGGRSHGRQTTAKPKQNSHKDDDDWSMGDWDLHQSADGGQHISGGRRHKRQRQVILLNDGYGGGGGGGGGWSGGGGGYSNGRVTTIDGRGYPGTIVRNSDCEGCNIRG